MRVIKQRERCDRRGLIILLALLVILPQGTLAQRLPLKLYTTADGLWSSNTTCLLRDSHGFIWLCTREGVSRFDGYRFVNYRIGSDPGSQHVAHILETRDGLFWFVMNSGGLYRYDPSIPSASWHEAATSPDGGDGRILLNAQLVSKSGFRLLYEDRKGNLWAGHKGLSLIEDRAGPISIRPMQLGLPQERKDSLKVSTIAEGSDGSLWLNTSVGILHRLPDGRTIQFNLGPKGEVATTLAIDGKDRLWIGFNTALYVLQTGPSPAASSLRVSPRVVKTRDSTASLELALAALREGEALHLSQITSGEQVFAIYPHSSGQIWISNPHTVLLLDGGHFHRYGVPETEYFAEDLDGELWMAGPTGVMKLSRDGMVSYRAEDGLVGPYILSLYDDPRGGLFAISRPWFVTSLEDGKVNAFPLKLPAPGPMWTSPGLFRDHTGQWWALTHRGLYRFPRLERADQLARASPSAIYTTLDGLPGKYVYCMFEDSRGDLWISVRANDPSSDVHGLVRWQRSTQTFHRLTEAEGLPAAKSAIAFAEDKAGNLWFGFYEGGLVRYHAGRITTLTAADGAPEGPVIALHLDHGGRLWTASNESGVTRSADPTAARPSFLRITTSQGLSSDNVRCITEDLDGRIYFGTVRGVDRLTPETGRIKHFGMSEGLAGDFVTSAHRDRKGALWFGTYNGLSRLDPQPDRVSAPAPILIDGLRIAGRKQPVSEFGAAAIAKLELSAAQSNLQIDFFSLSLARAASLRYQYTLEGSDRDWSPPVIQRTVHYANLAPGNYRFLVRAVDANGVTSPQPATVSFRILPPLWQRWWFLSLIAAMMTSIAVALYRYRVAQLLALERVRTRIATDLHDDIGSSLSQIAILSEVARLGPAPKPGVLSEIAAMSRELIDSMSDIVWTIKPENDHLSNLIFRMRRFATDVLSGRNIALQFHSTVEDRHLRTNTEMRREVYLIFKEAISNIARHSGAQQVRIELEVVKEDLILRITDNGCGFDPVSSDGGNGLHHMKKRAAGLGGEIEIRSSPGEGATITVKVPVASMRALSKLIAQ
jgi:signal transduction histidine kinase/ligand-binding sensor domain-containing protein